LNHQGGIPAGTDPLGSHPQGRPMNRNDSASPLPNSGQTESPRSDAIPAEIIQKYTPYLIVVARLSLIRIEKSKSLGARFDAEDIVQDAMLKAVQGWPGFRGEDEIVVKSWLLTIVKNSVKKAVRGHSTAKRDYVSEISFTQILDDSSGRIEDWARSQETTPGTRAVKNERKAALIEVLASLPDTQREATILHHIEGLTLDQTAEQMKVSKGSVVGYLYRAMSAIKRRRGELEGP
jgi:RNA polymerase sigma-70 factor (subfamily 1)